MAKDTNTKNDEKKSTQFHHSEANFYVRSTPVQVYLNGIRKFIIDYKNKKYNY
jgi:hypothetical protein